MPYNVSRHLRKIAKRLPAKPAIVLSSEKSITYAQLDAECDRFAHSFSEHGIQEGMRVIVFVRPGFKLVPTLFACFRIGAIPVCIDPGMKLPTLLQCIENAKAQALIGEPVALLLSRCFKKTFKTIKIKIKVPAITPAKFTVHPFVQAVTETDTPAAILFTSGSTGAAKGVVYTHSAFDEQQKLLRETYQIKEDEIDLVVFPLFALFSASWGVTAVISKMNPRKPAKANGKHLANVISKFKVTHTAGSPSIWKQLLDYTESTVVDFPKLNRILMAGAQVPESLVKRARKISKTIHTPYGMTEALPLTTISDNELSHSYEKTKLGSGTCVGKKLPGVEIALIPFTEEIIPTWKETLRLPLGTMGEIAVKCAWVTKEYFGKPEATQKAKILSEDGLWHRTGDVGYLDSEENLWYCGRKDHRIFTSSETLYPDPIEAIFDSYPEIKRSALVGVGKKGEQKPVLVIEGKTDQKNILKIFNECKNKFPFLKNLSRIHFQKHFPVDVRHNIKIDRIRLANLIESSVQ